MDDFSIIKLYIERSELAISTTAMRYGKYLSKIAWNILGNYQDAEECVNDTYLAAWNQIPPDQPLKFLPYLGRIARNLSLNRYNYLKANKRNQGFDLVLTELEDCLASSSTVEGAFDAQEVAMAINAFLASVKKEQRVIFVRRYWYGDSISTIAQDRKTSENNIKSVLFRMRKKLQRQLVKEGLLNES